jgi:CheY-like chemotaxis protein
MFSKGGVHMKKIMLVVVDDNLVSRLLPKFILRSLELHVQVLECETGSDALRLLEFHPVTHVLLDISMPKMDGMDVAKQIKANPNLSQIKLIAYTADAIFAHMSQFKSSGFDDVLLKPLDRESLFKVLALSDI